MIIETLANTPNTIKILVVDDEIHVHELLTNYLEQIRNPIYLLFSEDGSDGIVKLMNQEFDLLITDIDMPKTDGLEMIRNVQALKGTSNNKIPIIIMDDLLKAVHVKEAAKLGVKSILTKPFTEEQLYTKLKERIPNIKI